MHRRFWRPQTIRSVSLRPLSATTIPCTSAGFSEKPRGCRPPSIERSSGSSLLRRFRGSEVRGYLRMAGFPGTYYCLPNGFGKDCRSWGANFGQACCAKLVQKPEAAAFQATLTRRSSSLCEPLIAVRKLTDYNKCRVFWQRSTIHHDRSSDQTCKGRS